MYQGNAQATVRTVGALKKFLADLPDNLPVRGTFGDERITAVVWGKIDGTGPKKKLTFEEDFE